MSWKRSGLLGLICGCTVAAGCWADFPPARLVGGDGAADAVARESGAEAGVDGGADGVVDRPWDGPGDAGADGGGDLQPDLGPLAPTPSWAKRYGSNGSDELGGVAVDATGNVYLTGGFSGTVDFGNGPLNSAGQQDMVVLSLTSAGVLRWVKRFGGLHLDGGSRVVVSGDKVYVAGGFSDNVVFGAQLLQSVGSADGVLLCLDAGSGTVSWARSFGGPDLDWATAVTVDSAGEVFFSGNVITTNEGRQLIVGGIDSAGINYAWVKFYGGDDEDSAFAIAADQSGHVYVTGGFVGTATYGPGIELSSVPKGSNPSLDMYLLQLSATDGTAQWAKGFGAKNADYGYGVVTDAAGNVYWTGTFRNTIDFGQGPVATKGDSDVMLSSYTADGTLRWVETFGGEGGDIVHGLARGPAGHLYLTGGYGANLTGGEVGDIDFGAEVLSHDGGNNALDVLTVSYGADGSYRWSLGFGGPLPDQAWSVAAADGGALYLVGSLDHSLTVGGLPQLVGAGGVDGWVVKLVP